MVQIPGTKIIDINNVVRLRKQLAWASNWVAVLGVVCFIPFSKLELRSFRRLTTSSTGG